MNRFSTCPLCPYGAENFYKPQKPQKMKKIIKRLNEFDEMLEINEVIDWSTADPQEEFKSLRNCLKYIIIEAESKIKSPRDIMVEKLGHYVSEDNVSEALDKLTAQADIDSQVEADDVVCMWEPLEYRYTVSQLLDEIS